MATICNCYQHYIHTAIGMLIEKGLLRNELDWDVKKDKFTLRLFRAKNATYNILIKFRHADRTIVILDAQTHTKTEFQILFDDIKNKDDFHQFLLNYILQL